MKKEVLIAQKKLEHQTLQHNQIKKQVQLKNRRNSIGKKIIEGKN